MLLNWGRFFANGFDDNDENRLREQQVCTGALPKAILVRLLSSNVRRPEIGYSIREGEHSFVPWRLVASQIMARYQKCGISGHSPMAVVVLGAWIPGKIRDALGGSQAALFLPPRGKERPLQGSLGALTVSPHPIAIANCQNCQHSPAIRLRKNGRPWGQQEGRPSVDCFP